MSRTINVPERLPKVAIVGLFQGGKSLLINAALGGTVVPVGKFGLRTTPCRIRCRYGELSRAVAYLREEPPRTFNIHSFHSYVKTPDHVRNLEAVEFYHCHPILRQIELFDTPGIDYSEHDDESALSAAREADAVILVVQQSLPAASSAFSKISSCLKHKPWGLALNCGRAGPHLEHPNSPASLEVEEHCIRQLHEAGLHAPVFTQRMSALTLSYYAYNQADLRRSVVNTDEHQEHLAADEVSVKVWRNNLVSIGYYWLETKLEYVRDLILKSLTKQKWTNPTFNFDTLQKSFECCIGFDGVNYKVRGLFRIEDMLRHDRVFLYDFKCREQWVVEWFETQRDWHCWKF